MSWDGVWRHHFHMTYLQTSITWVRYDTIRHDRTLPLPLPLLLLVQHHHLQICSFPLFTLGLWGRGNSAPEASWAQTIRLFIFFFCVFSSERERKVRLCYAMICYLGVFLDLSAPWLGLVLLGVAHGSVSATICLWGRGCCCETRRRGDVGGGGGGGGGRGGP